MSKEHWRILAGKEYLIGEMLDKKEVTLTIERVERTEIQNQKGKETKPVAFFKGTNQRLVLNVTNMAAIADCLKTPYPEEWVGKQITLIAVQGTFFGKNQEVIRIKKDFSKVKM
jgi:hypothetical protein